MIEKTISLSLTLGNYKPFVSKTADELVFGYDDTLVALAHQLYPRNKRPLAQMGLLNGVSKILILKLRQKSNKILNVIDCVHDTEKKINNNYLSIFRNIDDLRELNFFPFSLVNNINLCTHCDSSHWILWYWIWTRT